MPRDPPAPTCTCCCAASSRSPSGAMSAVTMSCPRRHPHTLDPHRARPPRGRRARGFCASGSPRARPASAWKERGSCPDGPAHASTDAGRVMRDPRPLKGTWVLYVRTRRGLTRRGSGVLRPAELKQSRVAAPKTRVALRISRVESKRTRVALTAPRVRHRVPTFS